MRKKTNEILNRTAEWRDRGIEPKVARITLIAQYKLVSLQDAAAILFPRLADAQVEECAATIVDHVYSKHNENFSNPTP